jgi:undecaprenyl diphosphate synthase
MLIHMKNNDSFPALPQHIAIIPDGNRRWGKANGVGANGGHKKGEETFRTILTAMLEKEIPYVTFWAASEDNLIKRSRVEIMFLANALRREISSKSFLNDMQDRQVSVRFFGNSQKILHDKKLASAIRAAEQATARFDRFHLTILFGYDGRSEMIEAIKTIAHRMPERIDRATVCDALWTGILPPVDLIIRSGEETAGWCHWSAGFMMWQAAQAEFYTTKTLWPDFSKRELEHVLTEYTRRERRMGK